MLTAKIKNHVDVDAELEKAIHYHQAGQFKEAEEIYRKLISILKDK